MEISYKAQLANYNGDEITYRAGGSLLLDLKRASSNFPFQLE
ncbi:MAG: hypothetical protein N2327_07625 [Caldimicrobium sp.]|nr:hypothetical protein [Caldimicrobium sp.]MDW8093910.1 hypothetical protein [Caldimicrobium sp.]